MQREADSLHCRIEGSKPFISCTEGHTAQANAGGALEWLDTTGR
jgi:hypothetical protein